LEEDNMYKSDIEIAQESSMLPIIKIAQKLGIPEDSIENYGKYKAKIQFNDILASKKRMGN